MTTSDETEEDDDDDDDTITESYSRSSRVDIYRLAIRTNSEILEDLAAIIRILRQINALYRVFHNNSHHFTTLRTRRGFFSHVRRTNLSRQYDDNNDSIEDEEESVLDEDEEEANKLLEAGLEDLQAVLTMDSSHEDTGRRKRQSTLALLSLITYQYEHCSDQYLSRYLDPDGVYDPTLAIFAAAIYEEDEEGYEPKSCRDIMIAAEELYGPGWLKEFHKGKEGALRKMLEKLTFIAKIRLKIRDTDRPIAR
ncbi:uncharacterized protein B0P05DRAFT_528765 [Gilbertella persicaria]|uniref:uncharacterized protein n=1 Tax=Gilbertella persicaria TaxID=101096 RepID=UPI00221F2D47|nr:uncharacterized protein B0P05DRAFT_528765 [Gilbertella persicaria]KAI8091092.1 hypothetical protein B0P05DRAFT_528765 [Gilbertella persicaria]